MSVSNQANPITAETAERTARSTAYDTDKAAGQADNRTGEKAVKSTEPKTTEQVQRKAHSLVDQAAEKAAEIEGAVRERTSSAEEELSAKKDAAAEQFQESLEKAQEFARRRPVATAGIAFAAGLVAARLLRN